MSSNFLCLSVSNLDSSSLWRIDTIVFAKLNKPPPQIRPPSLLIPPLQIRLKYISPGGGGGNKDVRYCSIIFIFSRVLNSLQFVESITQACNVIVTLKPEEENQTDCFACSWFLSAPNFLSVVNRTQIWASKQGRAPFFFRQVPIPSLPVLAHAFKL